KLFDVFDLALAYPRKFGQLIKPNATCQLLHFSIILSDNWCIPIILPAKYLHRATLTCVLFALDHQRLIKFDAWVSHPSHCRYQSFAAKLSNKGSIHRAKISRKPRIKARLPIPLQSIEVVENRIKRVL